MVVMSKLSEMIQASMTNERRAVVTPVASFTSIVESPNSAQLSPIFYVYSLKAEFGCSATVQYGAEGHLNSKLKVVRLQVVEAIFGEFREDIHAIERALMNYDTDKAMELVGKMHNRMFDV